MVHYKLIYFNVRSAAEVCRQIFAFGEQEYEDVRMSDEEWAEFKASGKAPFNQLPVLEVDGKPLAQSHAIARYLAREFEINGKTEFEEAQVNALADQFKDYYAEVRPYAFSKLSLVEEDAETLYKTVFLPAFKKHYGYFSNSLKTSGSGFLVGDSLTWIDLLVAQHSANLLSREGEGLFKDFPELKIHCQDIQSIPQIKKWIEKRPVTLF